MKNQLILPKTYYYNQNNIYLTRHEAVQSNQDCTFYYYEKEFDSKDWSKEPIESLTELYKRRAQQIRDQYEYVVICYSGGIDSTQVLESFYYNNIHIDEILVVGALSQDSHKGSDENHNGDLYHNVFPTLNKMHLPNTKINVVDYTQWFTDPNNFSLLKQYGPEFYKHIGIRTSVHNLFWHDLNTLLNHNKQTAYVMGKDKPLVGLDTQLNKWYAFFSDISFVDYGNRYDYGNAKRVHFYSEPDAFDVMLKQYYMIVAEHERIKKLEKGPNLYDYLDFCSSVVYDVKNPLIHKSKKSQSLYLSARDLFMVDKKNSDIYKVFGQALSLMSKEVKSMKMANRAIFQSKKYYLS